MDTMVTLEWIGSLAGIGGAMLMAAKTRYSLWAYPLWIVSSVALLTFALFGRHDGLALQQGVFVAINLVGMLRWGVRPVSDALCPVGRKSFDATGR